MRLGDCAGLDRFRIDDIALLYEERFGEPAPEGFRTLHVHDLVHRARIRVRLHRPRRQRSKTVSARLRPAVREIEARS